MQLDQLVADVIGVFDICRWILRSARHTSRRADSGGNSDPSPGARKSVTSLSGVYSVEGQLLN